MNNSITLRCYDCNAVILQLTEVEIKNLNGLTFQCNCCGNQNLLDNGKFVEGSKENLYNSFHFSFKNITKKLFDIRSIY